MKILAFFIKSHQAKAKPPAGDRVAISDPILKRNKIAVNEHNEENEQKMRPLRIVEQNNFCPTRFLSARAEDVCRKGGLQAVLLVMFFLDSS